jgi:hypothetical protein
VIVQEMAMHRPVMWRPFLLEALERYRTRTGKRCVAWVHSQCPLELAHSPGPRR